MKRRLHSISHVIVSHTLSHVGYVLHEETREKFSFQLPSYVVQRANTLDAYKHLRLKNVKKKTTTKTKTKKRRDFSQSTLFAPQHTYSKPEWKSYHKNSVSNFQRNMWMIRERVRVKPFTNCVQIVPIFEKNSTQLNTRTINVKQNYLIFHTCFLLGRSPLNHRTLEDVRGSIFHSSMIRADHMRLVGFI